jgi:hypothetical protein
VETITDELIRKICDFDVWYGMSDDYTIWSFWDARDTEINNLLSQVVKDGVTYHSIFIDCLKRRNWSKSELKWLQYKLKQPDTVS